MTVASNLSAAVTDLKAELDSMGFLIPGARVEADQDLIDTVQAHLEELQTAHSALVGGRWGGRAVLPDAATLAHWLFDGEEHSVIFNVTPADSEAALVFETDVPFPWR